MKQLRRRASESKNDLCVGLFAIGVPSASLILLLIYQWLTIEFDLRDTASFVFLIAYALLAWVVAYVVVACSGLKGWWMLLSWPVWSVLLLVTKGTASWIFADLILAGPSHEIGDNASAFYGLIEFAALTVGLFGLASHIIYRIASRK